jgi:hypothetical protein
MTALNWAAFIVAILSICATTVGVLRWLVKHYLMELKENGGSSVKDQCNRLEARVDDIYRLLIERP